MVEDNKVSERSLEMRERARAAEQLGLAALQNTPHADRDLRRRLLWAWSYGPAPLPQAGHEPEEFKAVLAEAER
jgi:hypothetical protein